LLVNETPGEVARCRLPVSAEKGGRTKNEVFVEWLDGCQEFKVLAYYSPKGKMARHSFLLY